MNEREYFGHLTNDGKTQLLQDHLFGTATLAAATSADFGSRDWGHLAGLWHDIGKYSNEFQQKIRASEGEEAHIEAKGRVDHSTAGAQHASKCLDSAGKVLAYVIAGHHGGLPDGIAVDSCLKSRLEKSIPDYSCCPQEILKPMPLALPFKPSPDHAGIQLSMFIRMLYSCLVDADFLDTEQFMNSQKGECRLGYRTLEEVESAFFKELDQLRRIATSSDVNTQRERVLEQCLGASEKDMGLFSLTVPTGGGKTLSSMAFALRHAMKHGLKRVIYVIPFTSIIEQNADVFRRACGEDAVLEHHSNFEPETEDYRSRLVAENWDAPIVVTTNVQFFESLFANRSSRCRKLHSIASSVVILDEVQTLPAPFLLPCLGALKELSANYKVSVVLCSATQPAVQKRAAFAQGLEGVREIIDDPRCLSLTLKRTNVNVLPKTSDSDLAALLAKHKQVLCVVSTRKHARDIYTALRGMDGLFHLSALMCPVHRRQVLDLIRQTLKNGKTCRVVSTQLIEAGVDIDFPVVFRSLAGIDSIAQSAGRCNREGKLDKGQVFVFTPESGIPVGYFRQTAQAAESVIRRYADDILSLSAIEDYFKHYYWMKGAGLDEERILAMLHAGCGKGDFPFKTVAEKFRFIKDEMKPVVIQFDNDARRLVDVLGHLEFPASLGRKLQKYTVSVHPGDWGRLLSLGSIKVIAGIFPILKDQTLYDKNLGLRADDPTAHEPESLLV